jgi:hypothetical protein
MLKFMALVAHFVSIKMTLRLCVNMPKNLNVKILSTFMFML